MTVRAIRVKKTYAHWCHTYLWAIIQATIRLTKPTSHVITVSIAIAASKIMAATLKTAQQNDRESDSSKIAHMHIDAVHTYERSSKQQFDSQSLLVAPSLSPWHHCHQRNGWNLENNTTKQRVSNLSKITHKYQCYTYLWAIVQATLQHTKLIGLAIAVAIAAAKILVKPANNTTKQPWERFE